MPEKSGFFDSTAGDMREYPARDFAEYFARFVTNGVFNGGQYLNPTASGQDANIFLSPGYAWINGYVYSIYDSSLVLPIEPAAALDRIDRIILRLDTSTPVRSIRALVVQGLPASNPTPPALIRSGNIYDLSIAQVRVPANSTIITQANITDERLNQDVCGLVNSLIRVDTAAFQAQWDAFMQSVQDQGFATTAYVDNRVLTGGYGTTTNSGNTYSVTINPAPVAIVAGLRITVKFNATNTGAATINVNGLGTRNILKANGNAVSSGNLKANSVYTLVFSGSAFILQGEGGGGTARPDQVESGYTFTNDNGEQTGTLSKKAFVDAIISKGVAASINDSFPVLAQKIGQIELGKKFASGTANSAPDTKVFTRSGGIANYVSNYLHVTGLTFLPSLIYVQTNIFSITVYKVGANFNNGGANANIVKTSITPTGTGGGFSADGIMSVGAAIVNSSEFVLPVYSQNTPCFWMAFE